MTPAHVAVENSQESLTGKLHLFRFRRTHRVGSRPYIGGDMQEVESFPPVRKRNESFVYLHGRFRAVSNPTARYHH